MLDNEWMKHPLQQLGYSGKNRTGRTGDLSSLRLLQGPPLAANPILRMQITVSSRRRCQERAPCKTPAPWLALRKLRIFVCVSGARVGPRAGLRAHRGITQLQLLFLCLICVRVCLCVGVCECECSHRPGALDPGVTHRGAGNQIQVPKEQCIVLTAEPPLPALLTQH
jgi:hypothetical protein